MSIQIENAYDSISKLNLWFKLNDNQELMLTDVPEIIPYRWEYFKEQWLIIKQSYINKIQSYPDPDRLSKEIDSFSSFIFNQSIAKSNPFSDGDILYRFFSIFDVSPINKIPLTKDEADIVSKKTNIIKNYIRKDFLDIRKNVIIARDYLADITNTNDEDYNRIFGKSSIASQISINNKNINLMLYFQQSVSTIDFILVNIFSLNTSPIDPFALAKQNAANSSVDVSLYNSGNLKRFNFGESLQDIAARELGDSDKWIELAIANGLKPPYIDEIGEKINLLSNANGNQLNISASTLDNKLNIDRIFINQVILIQSNSYPFPDQRIITNIVQAPISGEIIISVNGDSDLDKYKISDNAHIRVYKPNTINSSFLILIPSVEPLDDEVKKDVPWFLKSSSESEKRQKVDLLLSENGDLALTPNDDFNISFGLNNAIQALKLKLSIERGELKRHDDFGIISVTGLTNVDIPSIESFLIETISDVITKDGRFDRIETLSVVYFSGQNGTGTGTGFHVFVETRLAGSESVIPIAFTVNL